MLRAKFLMEKQNYAEQDQLRMPRENQSKGPQPVVKLGSTRKSEVQLLGNTHFSSTKV